MVARVGCCPAFYVSCMSVTLKMVVRVVALLRYMSVTSKMMTRGVVMLRYMSVTGRERWCRAWVLTLLFNAARMAH
jgi:hypothetical protein